MKEEHRRKGGKCFVPWVLLLLFLVAFPGSGLAFNIVGPRAMGMGGAFVAVCDDATAVYWNPAALTQIKGFMDISLFAGAQATDNFSDDLNDLEKWFDDHSLKTLTLSDVEDLKDILERFNRKDEGVFANANAGLSLATKWVALSSVAVSEGKLATHADLEPSHFITKAGRTQNGSRADLGTLLTNNIALTGATTLGIPNLALGVSAKYIWARQYTDTEYVFDRSTGEFNQDITDLDHWWKEFSHNKVDGWAWGIDAGALVILGNIFKIGVLGRNINEPKIDWGHDHPDTKLRGQYRAGAALTLFDVLTISADGDLSEQGREVIETEDGRKFKFNKSQEFSAGLEWWVLGRYLALRGGVNNILDNGDAGRLYTAGLGLRVPFVGLDLAGGYGGEGRYAFSLGLNVRF
jgi:hypothetical protein